MAVVQPDYDSTPRGKTDTARHRQKIKDALRRNLPDIIGDEAIITRKEDRIVKVPVRGVKSYRFIHRHGNGGGGLGTGEGRKGKVLGRRPKPGHGRPGEPGDQPGVDYLETEIDLAELIEMMLQDLGLPNLRRKETRETVIPRGWTYDSIERSGIRPRLDKKRTVKEAIKRTELLAGMLAGETGRPLEECRRALARAGGDLAAARALLEPHAPAAGPGEETAPAGQVAGEAASGGEAPGEDTFFLDSSDLRYRTVTEDVEHRSNAVVLAMMDVSGSMDIRKKYFARSFYFWMLAFLRARYRHAEIRFIAHTTEARLVDEHEFFHKGESGGTRCASAYELAARLVEAEYPAARWNVYPFHFSDGEDWDPPATVRAVRALLDRGMAALGYGEIQSDYSSSMLMSSLRKELDLEEAVHESFRYYRRYWNQTPVLGVTIREKGDLYPALRTFLHQDRVPGVSA
jgi:hypothetical protein